MLKEEQDPIVTSILISAVGKFTQRDEKVGNRIAKVYLKDKEWIIRKMACRALCMIMPSPDKMVEFLQPLLSDLKKEVRTEALRSLRKVCWKNEKVTKRAIELTRKEKKILGILNGLCLLPAYDMVGSTFVLDFLLEIFSSPTVKQEVKDFLITSNILVLSITQEQVFSQKVFEAILEGSPDFWRQLMNMYGFPTDKINPLLLEVAKTAKNSTRVEAIKCMRLEVETLTEEKQNSYSLFCQMTTQTFKTLQRKS